MIPKTPKHNRIKPRNSITSEHRAYWEYIRSVKCLVCCKDAEIHHIIHRIYNEDTGELDHKRKDHFNVVPLCSWHHRSHEGFHGLGSDEAFKELHNVSLPEESENLLAQYKETL